MSKLAIAPETDEDRYDMTTTVVCYACHDNNVDKSHGKLPEVVDGVMKALTFSRQEEVKAWEQEFTPCEHTRHLEQDQSSENNSKGSKTHDIPSQCDSITNISVFPQRPVAMFDVRLKREPMAMSSMRKCWMWSSPIRRLGGQFTCAGPFRHLSPSSGYKATVDHT